MRKIIFRLKGGPGSGFTSEDGHRGIPGVQGGSQDADGGKDNDSLTSIGEKLGSGNSYSLKVGLINGQPYGYSIIHLGEQVKVIAYGKKSLSKMNKLFATEKLAAEAIRKDIELAEPKYSSTMTEEQNPIIEKKPKGPYGSYK